MTTAVGRCARNSPPSSVNALNVFAKCTQNHSDVAAQCRKRVFGLKCVLACARRPNLLIDKFVECRDVTLSFGFDLLSDSLAELRFQLMTHFH
jgi:hypothetical protein